ncbi:MAG TPA: exosortase-associated EpsI family protein [Verrucomicrobiae bacterium]|nr:exosortase-associated EpsI family protein [Verrucomicrobiae bacterium]
MKRNQKWLILVAVLALIAATGGALTWLKQHQKLGQPGIKAAAIPGSIAMKIDLPERALDFASTNVPESDVELGYFPKDTSFVERLYTSPDAPSGISATIILMGADRTSIHRPEYCLAGQGFACDEKQVVNIPVEGPQPYQLPVAKWKVSRMVNQPDGQSFKMSGVYVFWFAADNEQTTGIVPFQCYLVRDLLLKGILQRWAYISYFAPCLPGQEEATFERMKGLIAASVPEFQLPPKSANTISRLK